MTKEERFEILKALCYSVPQNTNVDPHQFSAAIVSTYKGVIDGLTAFWHKQIDYDTKDNKKGAT